MKQLALEVIALTESKSKCVFLPLPGDDPLTREPDIRKAQELLNWAPTVNRFEGLSATVKYFKESLGLTK
jgi:dTDP-glucose 4,6-dehydratase